MWVSGPPPSPGSSLPTWGDPPAGLGEGLGADPFSYPSALCLWDSLFVLSAGDSTPRLCLFLTPLAGRVGAPSALSMSFSLGSFRDLFRGPGCRPHWTELSPSRHLLPVTWGGGPLASFCWASIPSPVPLSLLVFAFVLEHIHQLLLETGAQRAKFSRSRRSNEVFILLIGRRLEVTFPWNS